MFGGMPTRQQHEPQNWSNRSGERTMKYGCSERARWICNNGYIFKRAVARSRAHWKINVPLYVPSYRAVSGLGAKNSCQLIHPPYLQGSAHIANIAGAEHVAMGADECEMFWDQLGLGKPPLSRLLAILSSWGRVLLTTGYNRGLLSYRNSPSNMRERLGKQKRIFQSAYRNM